MPYFFEVEATQAKLKFFICRTWSYTAFRLSEQVISVNPVKYVFLVDIQIDSKEEDIEFPTLGNYAVIKLRSLQAGT